jgi:2,4-dienoyl-CoA reductase-like NADH-dependent reductase (Old Yellow Enzyme family)
MRVAPSEPSAASADRQAPYLFRPLQLRDLTLRNRMVVSPMCEYSCERQDGLATDWHFVHLSTRAVGGAGLVFTEAAAVTPEGRISPQDLGYWSDAHAEALERTLDFVHAQGAAFGVQLAHAGRKASTHRPWEPGAGVPDEAGGWTPVGPTDEPHAEGYRVPRALSAHELRPRVIEPFAAAAARAARAGVDVIELHAAHGYLLHQFLSPIANQRTDAYGGSFEGRARLLLEVVDAVRAVWPASRPLFVRLSCTEWIPGGWDVEASVRLAHLLGARGADLIDCSSGGISPAQQVRVEPGYQVPFAEQVRREAHIATGAVGLITEPAQAERVLMQGQADVVLLARELLRDPYFPLRAAHTLGADDAAPWPVQYERARPRALHPGQR